MVTVKSSQKIFTDSEVASLTGICVEHVHNFAKSRHLGFIARAAEAAGINADQWLFTLSDLMVLVTLFPKCSHFISRFHLRFGRLPDEVVEPFVFLEGQSAGCRLERHGGMLAIEANRTASQASHTIG